MGEAASRSSRRRLSRLICTRSARLDFDIDLAVLADNPEAFRDDGSWIEAID